MRLIVILTLGAAVGLSPQILGADSKLLTGKAAMSDWTSDSPGVRRKITVAGLPPPNEKQSTSNGPDIVRQPEGAQWHVPAGFKIEPHASGFRDPRFLLTAPNGDIFLTESRADQIKVLRDTNGGGKRVSSNSTPTAAAARFLPGAFATPSALLFVPAPMSSG